MSKLGRNAKEYMYHRDRYMTRSKACASCVLVETTVKFTRNAKKD